MSGKYSPPAFEGAPELSFSGPDFVFQPITTSGDQKFHSKAIEAMTSNIQTIPLMLTDSSGNDLLNDSSSQTNNTQSNLHNEAIAPVRVPSTGFSSTLF